MAQKPVAITDKCLRLAAYGSVTGCDADQLNKPVVLNPSALFRKVATAAFFNSVRMYESKPKPLRQKFTDCVAHALGESGAWCGEL
jgi:hypothetical protein